MMKNFFYLLLIISLNSFAQDEQLRTEIIDVFKEYDPEIINSRKISQQPIFNDTLKNTIITHKSILNEHLFIKENLLNIQPNKFRFKIGHNNFKKYLSFDVGSVGFLNTKVHYTNGISTIHNSGLYFEHDTKSYLIKKDYDGYGSTSLNLYSNRFLNNKLLNTSFNISNQAGFYWGGKTDFPIDSIERYNVSNVGLKIDLDQLSNNHILNEANIHINYLFNNYQRKELLIQSSIGLETEKALKTYSFKLQSQLMNNSFNNFSNNLDLNPINNRIVSLNSGNNFSDILLKSNFIISGTNMLDYKIGLDFYYFPSNEVRYGGEPLIFPTIKLLKKISNNERLEFSLYKNLTYHSFYHIFNILPYVDPYYRNSLSKQFKINLAYSRRVGAHLNLTSDLTYLTERGKLIPFRFYERSQIMDHNISVLELAPLGLYQDKLQKGFVWFSSISYNQEKYNFLLEGKWNSVKSIDHDNRQFVPKFEINSTITLHILKNINIIYNCYFKGSQDLIRIESIYDLDTPFQYSQLPSYLNMNMSLNYTIDSMVFSLDFQNILNQDQYFFDTYYNNDGLRMSLGLLYKF